MHTSSLEILEKSQLSGAQAKAILQVMEFELSAQSEIQATKSDVNTLEQRMTAEIARLRSEMEIGLARLELKIEAAKSEFARLMLTALASQTAFVLGAFYFFLNYARK